jgi:Fic family protein
MAKRLLSEAIIEYLSERQASGVSGVGAHELTEQVLEPRSTVNRHLIRLVKAGAIIREGSGPATVYSLPATGARGAATTPTIPNQTDGVARQGPTWGNTARALRAQLEAPIGLRTPVSYQRQFVDRYTPNESSLLPADLAVSLHEQGRLQGQQPAGTYARRVLEQLLIDLSWYSSRLEGNSKSLLDTRDLFLKGRSEGDDLDATMLLNHKDAIEFIVDAVPTYGITLPVVRNIQAILMNGLLANPASLGATRRTVVNISDSVYLPTQVPALLDEMLSAIVEKTRAIKNPVECGFFLWVNIAYLQPFEDGNKRTSRLCSNLPLLLSNCAPLSFLDVEPADYALAMLGVYERGDVALAIDLFEWTYRRSIVKYRAVLESMGALNPFRARYREHLGDAVRQIVAAGATVAEAVAELAIPATDQKAFEDLLRLELASLEPYNCARYRLTMSKTEDWIARGRPA